MKKEDWLNTLACELPGLSNRTRNAMQRRRRSTVRDLLKELDRLKPSGIGRPFRHRLGWGAGSEAVSELRKSLMSIGFTYEDNFLLSNNPNEFNISGFQEKFGLDRKKAELFTGIAIKEGWFSPSPFKD
jgi:hypothetical protein